MKNRLPLLQCLALILPLVFLGGMTLIHAYDRAYAEDFDVAVQGYDPRDLVYGKYVMLRYDWGDPRSEHPARDDLPVSGRFYVPEGDAMDLQTMLREKPESFMATVHFQGEDLAIETLSIDGRPWQEGLAAWRQTRDNGDYD